MVATLLGAVALFSAAQEPSESDFYEVIDIEIPDNVVLEVGGLEQVGPETLLACTRRGEVWRIDDFRSSKPEFSLWADGLQEPLGLLSQKGWIYCVTRGELMRMRDSDDDGSADEFRTIADGWDISGNYHEYNFGPRVDLQGNLWLTTNKPFGGEPFGRVEWRGWAMKVTPEGEMIPFAGGLRSPAGVEVSPWGEPFYTDNQGEWCGASKLSHIEEGDFHGHPHGIGSAKLPGSRVEHPGDVPNGIMMPLAKDEVRGFKLPAVWFPYDKMGRSPSGMAWDTSGGFFGPFDGQLFVGDQYSAELMRGSLEEVEGHWQGACYPFRHGLGTGLIRVRQLEGGEMLVGGSDRGWAALGAKPWALQRLRWTGKVPFEVLEMKAAPGGFVLHFTETIDPDTLDNVELKMSSYTYELHAAYGSKEFETENLNVGPLQSLPLDSKAYFLPVKGLRSGYVHELHIDGVRSINGEALLHKQVYYTLIHLAEAPE
ncbi:MAG: hypothetical protein MK209_06915 [Planctomycetes bacterium]|nr:hypothetical protein [Planctomycetota bacterium]